MSFGDIVSIIGLVVSGVGFWFTIAQLRRTATATEASNVLLAAVGQRMQMNHLLVTLPQLHVLADELDAGVLADDSRAVARTLVAYSRIASQIAELLEADTAKPETTLVERLRASSTAASGAKSTIVSGTREPLPKFLKPIMTDISDISNIAGALVSRYQMNVS